MAIIKTIIMAITTDIIMVKITITITIIITMAIILIIIIEDLRKEELQQRLKKLMYSQKRKSKL